MAKHILSGVNTKGVSFGRNIVTLGEFGVYRVIKENLNRISGTFYCDVDGFFRESSGSYGTFVEYGLPYKAGSFVVFENTAAMYFAASAAGSSRFLESLK